jgi:hypothetical protein
MTMKTIKLSLPNDDDGFFRRECPECEREFKVIAESRPRGAAPKTAGDSFFCPYCAKSFPVDHFWTQAQLKYRQGIAVHEGLGPALEKFSRSLKSLERHSSKNLKIKVTSKGSGPRKPAPLQEPNDMVRVDPPCHSEPIKIDEDWTADVACLICGKSYGRTELAKPA